MIRILKVVCVSEGHTYQTTGKSGFFDDGFQNTAKQIGRTVINVVRACGQTQLLVFLWQ